MKHTLSPEMLAWRQAHIRCAALKLRYRRLCSRTDTPSTQLADTLRQTESAQAACRRLRKPQTS